MILEIHEERTQEMNILKVHIRESTLTEGYKKSPLDTLPTSMRPSSHWTSLLLEAKVHIKNNDNSNEHVLDSYDVLQFTDK